MGASSDKNDEISYKNEIISYDLNEGLLCPICREIPEVLNINTDNSKIEFNCKKCGVYEILIDEYFDKLSKSDKFKICSSCENKSKKNKYYYCFNCNKDYCEECKYRYHYNHECIEVNEKKNICLRKNKEFIYFCFDCQENLCEIDKIAHRNHKVDIISRYREHLIKDKYKIKKINEELNNLIEFNNIILRNEEYFINSIKNIGKSLEEENKRDSKDIKCLFTGLSRGIEVSCKAIYELKKYQNIYLYRKDKYLHLYNRELDNQDFKFLSQIRFNQLKEIDISENRISNIEPFNKMSLPFLEFLNLSHNRIQIIEPVAKLKSNNLEYIFVQGNIIEDIEAFLESYFPSLKILRVEEYNIFEEYENDQKKKKKRKELLDKINKKYHEKFIYKSIVEQMKEFRKKYKLEIDAFNLAEEFDLRNLEGGDEMLKKLFLIITFESKNKIKYLNLRNNGIKDPSMLNRINFNKLVDLDLGANKIEDLKFLQNMKSEKLKRLYLDNNLFNDIYPIININAHFPSLEFLSL